MANTKYLDFEFYQYLNLFYHQNKKTIRACYKDVTRKFLDFNDPDNPVAYLRRPQYEALEMYVFLKEYLCNPNLERAFEDWYNERGKFQGRKIFGLDEHNQLSFFEEGNEDFFSAVHRRMSEFKQTYPNYIFALTMGTGKTRLMATAIFYEFLLANKYPKDRKYCRNALVFVPDKTVLHSVLEDIRSFDKKNVVPPEYVNWLETHLQFHFLDDSGCSLNTIDRSDFNIIISNTQKIILKKRHKEKNSVQKLFSESVGNYRVKSITKGYEDLYDFDIDDELSLLENQRFLKLTRLKQLGIYVDEAHHVFGNRLEKDIYHNKKYTTSLRLTINELAASLKEAGSHVVACYNFTGTPFVKNKVLPEVVYAYGLRQAIDNVYLKQVEVKGISNAKTKEFVRIAITQFWKQHQNRRCEDMLPKIALFASTIDELKQNLRPFVEQVLSDLGIPISKILVNVGDDKLTTNDDLREFKNLDTPASEKQFILLVNKGKEGWNCRSLFAVALYRKPRSKIFVLQSTMRCLRFIGDFQEKARVFLSNENMEILESELQSNYRVSISEINKAGNQNKMVKVKLVPPPVKVKLKRVRKLHELVEKTPRDEIDLKFEEVDPKKYDITVETKDICPSGTTSTTKQNMNQFKEKRVFSTLMLVAEISRYLNRSPVQIEKILRSSKQGIEQIIKKVNAYNELLYDWIIPKLFKEMYDLKESETMEDLEVELAKEPSGGCYWVSADPRLIAAVSDPFYSQHQNKSFHLDKYCFDSNPEKAYFGKLLTDNGIEKVYFTGMLTHGQSEFIIYYIDPQSHTLRSYYPDFLVQKHNGHYIILEVKDDRKIDDPVVKAKAEYARQMATASGMNYMIVKSSEAESKTSLKLKYS